MAPFDTMRRLTRPQLPRELLEYGQMIIWHPCLGRHPWRTLEPCPPCSCCFGRTMPCTRHLALAVPAAVALAYAVAVLLVSQGQAESLAWVTVTSFNGSAGASNVWSFVDSYRLNGETQTSFCPVVQSSDTSSWVPCLFNPSFHAPPPLASFSSGGVDLSAASAAMKPWGGAAAALTVAMALTFVFGVCPSLRMAPPGRAEGSPTTASLVAAFAAFGVAAAACEGAFLGTFDERVFLPLLANATAFSLEPTTPFPPAAGAPPFILSPGEAQPLCIAAIALAVAPSVSWERSRASVRARAQR